MEDKKIKEVEKATQDIKTKVVEESKDHIKLLEDKIQELSQENGKLSEKNLILTNEIKKQVEDFENEKWSLNDLYEEEMKQRIMLEQELKIIEEKEYELAEESKSKFKEI